ncbi:MAG: hypothetical protein IPM63_11250 [Acidobacteriota bacterium]|nr:MAG: hypothetical protein IPM63_11250 [Acidobacteriota bacterium]
MINGTAIPFRKVISPVSILLLILSFAAGAFAQDELDGLLSRLDSVRELSKQCVSTDCPDADRAAMQKLLNGLEDAQLFARLQAFWITQLPNYENSTDLRQRVVKLRSVHDAIRNLIFKSSDGDSLMYCVVKLNEARGEDLSKALIDFKQNTGKERVSAWVWESVSMVGNSLSLDTTDTPEKAPEAVKELGPTIGKTLEGLSVPEIRTAQSKIDPGDKPYDPGAQITINYELSPCVRLPTFFLISKSDAQRSFWNSTHIITSRDTVSTSGTVHLTAPQLVGEYVIMVSDRYSGSPIAAGAEITVRGFRSTGFPGVYQIRQSGLNSEIGSHIAIVVDNNGVHYWGWAFQTPVSDEWQFSERVFASDPSRQAYVSKAELEGTTLKIVRVTATCEGSEKEVAVTTEIYLQSEGTMMIGRRQSWDCSSGAPVIKEGELEFDFQAVRVSGEPPAMPSSDGRKRIASEPR